MICVCDIGTSSLKAGIINREGKLVCFIKIPLQTFQPDFSAIKWEKALFDAVASFPENVRNAIEAIAVSGHGPTLVPLDKNNQPGRPLFWFDQRYKKETFSSASYFLPKIADLKLRSPDAYSRVQIFLPCPEYLCFLLTEEKKAVIPHDGFIPYYWNDAACAAMGIERGKLPPLTPCTAVFGRLTTAAAAALGVPADIPVFCTGPDFLAASLGTLAFNPGTVHVRGGTSEAVNTSCRKNDPVVMKAAKNSSLRIVPGFLSGTINIARFLPHIGRMHAFLATLLYPGQDALHRMCVESLTAGPGARGLQFVMPEMENGELFRDISLNDCFSGGAANRSLQEYGRAFLEFAAGQIAAACRELNTIGIEIAELIAVGGLSKCHAYNVLKASFAGIPVKIPTVQDTELIGNAAVAAAGMGYFPDPQYAAKVFFKTAHTVEPDPVLAADFQNRRE
ncbi:MAG: FGGY-family carbohydrate kinase [Spirochaetales bacterium]|nr:FGGY-family carbohydrate kinase [Spirochaetales bacterium]